MSRGKYTRTENTRKKMSVARMGMPSPRKGVHLSDATKQKVREARLGKKFSTEARLKMSISQKRRVKEGRHHLWKGGITPLNMKIRHSVEYKLWRESVFARDKYTCIWCKDDKGGNLEADHIKPFSLFPELRFAIDNGRTLCKPCHKKTNTWGYKLFIG